MLEPSHLGKIVLVSVWFKMGIDPNNNLGIKRFSHLHRIQYLISITISIPTSRFFDTNIDVDY